MSSPSASRPFDDLLQAVRAVRHLDRRFWAPNVVFLLDGAAYFGILNVLTLHLDGTVGLGEARAGQLVSYMTALLTIAMVFLGPSVDKLGVRRSLTWTIVASLLGRALLVATPAVGGGLPMVIVGLSLMAVGGGVMQTAVYAGVKQATDERTSSVGFSLIYALMNLGIVLESAVSSPVRATWGTTGVLAMCTGLTALYLVVHLFSFPKRAGEPLPPAPPDPTQAPKTWREHPLLDLRFL
jgi:POT family proton-dependent oligopeptide transporter